MPRFADVTDSDVDVCSHDNDFEVFVGDGSNAFYKEIEMNAAGADWDLCLNKPYIDGGGENSTRVFGPSGFDLVSEGVREYVHACVSE